MHRFCVSGFGVCRFRGEFRRSLVVGLGVVPGQQIRRGADLGPVLGLHFNFEIRGLVGVDLGDFRLGLGQRLAAGFEGSA